MALRTIFAGCILAESILAGIPGAAAGEFPEFRHVEIDPFCGNVCYAVTLADVDTDGRIDIVAVTEDRVLWYQNPNWQKRVIIEDQTERDNVCIAPFDIDGDGQIDFALGAGWTKIGTIGWLARPEKLDDAWQVHAIGRERWLHRMRFADVLGTGTPQLVISPLNRTSGAGVRLTAYEVPDDPHRARWRPTVLDDSLNRMHNHWHADLDGNGSIDTLTASQEGVHWITRSGEDWSKQQLSGGAKGSSPETSGAGEIKTGHFRQGEPFIATIEPMHGNQVVVYTRTDAAGALGSRLRSLHAPAGPQETAGSRLKGKPPLAAGEAWTRQVLDDSLGRGHAVWLADVDGDQADELIVGHSDPGTGPVKGPGLYVYDAHASRFDAEERRSDAGIAPPRSWTKHIVDNGGIAVEDAIAGDLTGDGRIDIVAGGRATHNIKLYVNEGTRATSR